ncbi:exosortase-associated EpsI family protein [Armatimonas rosea]|uniref:Methanolan biosynthesis EpsI domain-containing protein n=1 Tax=Armatimonas rosea TaxID=685828 RepID=A0A7W9SLA1_ARMRO|nr:exosortase-associated EpsI family protein [Armatimonas rosea]MBB6048731.1 hypothetical protein [Armatimonas rosea]
MKNNNNSKKNSLLWSALLATIVVGAVLDRVPLRDASERLERLPAFSHELATREAEVTEAEHKVFGEARIFRREVALEHQGFMLTVIDGTQNRHALHDPYYCVQGAGYQIVRSEKVPIAGGSACQLTVRKGSQERRLVFYFSNGHERHDSPIRAWAESALRRLSLGRSSEAQVLVLIEPLTEGAQVNTLLSGFPHLTEL